MTSVAAHAGCLPQTAPTPSISVAKDLAVLTGVETETNRLRRQLSSAEQELSEITVRAGEKRIAAAMTENNLSPIKIVQPASIPFETASPSLWLFLAVGSFLSVFAAVGGACLLQMILARRKSRYPNQTLAAIQPLRQ
jgi:uncharacterized protein involved in exopolysaccharide biosynthesis